MPDLTDRVIRVSFAPEVRTCFKDKNESEDINMDWTLGDALPHLTDTVVIQRLKKTCENNGIGKVQYKDKSKDNDKDVRDPTSLVARHQISAQRQIHTNANANTK